MSDAAAGKGPKDEVILAAVVGAHGIQGEVRLKLFAESIESLRRHRSILVGGTPLTLVAVKGDGTPIARLAEITDRSAAESLRGQTLTVPRDALPPLAEGEYYHADLVGLTCESPEGDVLGSVKAVENFGAGDILEIETPDGRLSMVPFKPGIADIGDGKIVVDPLFLA